MTTYAKYADMYRQRLARSQDHQVSNQNSVSNQSMIWSFVCEHSWKFRTEYPQWDLTQLSKVSSINSISLSCWIRRHSLLSSSSNNLVCLPRAHQLDKAAVLLWCKALTRFLLTWSSLKTDLPIWHFLRCSWSEWLRRAPMHSASKKKSKPFRLKWQVKRKKYPTLDALSSFFKAFLRLRKKMFRV